MGGCTACECACFTTIHAFVIKIHCLTQSGLELMFKRLMTVHVSTCTCLVSDDGLSSVCLPYLGLYCACKVIQQTQACNNPLPHITFMTRRNRKKQLLCTHLTLASSVSNSLLLASYMNLKTMLSSSVPPLLSLCLMFRYSFDKLSLHFCPVFAARLFIVCG